MLRKLRGIVLAVLWILLWPVLGFTGPVINLLNYNNGFSSFNTTPTSVFDIVGTNIYVPGSTSVTFTGPIGSSTSATTASVLGPWSPTEIDDVSVPSYLTNGMYAVQVRANGSWSNALDFDVTNGGATDTDPHSGYSTSTNYCYQCHSVHGASGGAQYGLLDTGSVSAVCEQCHSVAGSTATGGPIDVFTGTVGTVSNLAVYENTGTNDAGHKLTQLLYGNSENLDTSVSLGYLNLNTTGYQTSQYPPSPENGLGCDSCHTAHGTDSANLWTGWDASQFSANYGYNVDGSVYNDPFAGHNESWRLTAGTVPLTNALLVKNPGYQGGINNSTTNQYIPVRDDSPTSRLWGQTIPGWGDDNLSNWCLGCHNLVTSATGHINGHPLQAAAGTSGSDPNGSFAPITQGCMDCHGNPLASVWNTVYDSTGFYAFTYPSSVDLTNKNWDFPHTSTNWKLLKNYDNSSTTALCGTCHNKLNITFSG